MCQVNSFFYRCRLSVLVIALFVFSGINAQEHKGKFDAARFRADLEQYIIQKAKLSQKEAARFFPVYNEMTNKQHSIHDKIKKLKKTKLSTEAEYKSNVRQRDKLELELKSIQKMYHEKFMRILPAKKVYEVIKAEDRFHRKAFQRAAERMNPKGK